jgi:hypothetical protein
VQNNPVALVDPIGLQVVTWYGPSCGPALYSAIEVAYTSKTVQKLRNALAYDQIPVEFQSIVECLVGQENKVNSVKVECNPCTCWISNTAGGVNFLPGVIGICMRAFNPAFKPSLGTVVAAELAKNQCGLTAGREYAFAAWLEGL